MKQYKISAILIMTHGVTEIFGFLSLLPVWLLGSEQVDTIAFAMPFLQDNMELVVIMGALWGSIRLVGATGLFKNRMWGLVLSTINCIITMPLAIFMLPFGVKDFILAGLALVLILTQYFGKKKIIE